MNRINLTPDDIRTMANDGSVQKGDVKIHIPGEEGAKEAAEAFECQWDLVPESEKDPEVDL